MRFYEIITNKIIEQPENGVVPWQRPWKTTFPTNFVSKRMYRGINVLMLSMQDFDCEYWATFKQIRKAGGNVRKGSKGILLGGADEHLPEGGPAAALGGPAAAPAVRILLCLGVGWQGAGRSWGVPRSVGGAY